MIKFWHKELSNISDKATIGDGSVIHSGVDIHDEVVIGNECQIEAMVFLPNGVTLQDKVFVGPHVVFTNDPKLDTAREEWKPTKTLVKAGAKIGANSTIRAGVIIGYNSIVGCGSVVLHDIPDDEVWAGNPCKFIRKINN